MKNRAALCQHVKHHALSNGRGRLMGNADQTPLQRGRPLDSEVE